MVPVGKPVGNRPHGKPGTDGGTILRWIVRKWDGECTGLIWLRIGMGGGQIRIWQSTVRFHSSIKCRKCLD
jgi:hypothetical protein